MEDLTLVVKDLREKIEELVKKHRETLNDFNTLKMKNTEISALLKAQEVTIKELTENNKLLKLSESIRTRGDMKATNLKINELVREIDKCIAQLNR